MEWNETRQSNVASTTTATIISVNSGSDDAAGEDSRSNGADAVAHYYGKLMKQSLMNTFNVNNEFIESTTVPDLSEGGVSTMYSSTIVLIFKCFVIGFIILAAIFGNMLIMVSVMQHRKLR